MTQTLHTPAIQLLERILMQLERQTGSVDALCARMDSLKSAPAHNGSDDSDANGHSDHGNPTAPAVRAPVTGEHVIEFDAEEIVATLDDTGTRKLFRIKGGPYSTYGLRVWPEVLETLGFEPELLDLGATPCHLRVAARVGIQGKQKVIGSAGGVH